jgi:hypothetical protein
MLVQQKKQARTLKEAFGPYADWPAEKKDGRILQGATAAAIAAGYAVAMFVLLTEWQASPPPPATVKHSVTAQVRP